MKVPGYVNDSVKVIVSDTGIPVSRLEYLPYGETWFQDGDENYAPKYNSQELDKESGVYFYNARHYDPEIGRFVTADNIIDGQLNTQGWNGFAYVKGNPIEYKDPTGHHTAKGDWNEYLSSSNNSSEETKNVKFSKPLTGNEIKKELLANLEVNKDGTYKRIGKCYVTKFGDTRVLIGESTKGSGDHILKRIK